MPQGELPNVVTKYTELLKANFVVSADSSRFFFQLAMAKRRGSPYTFKVGNKLYQWRVIPMGVAWAVKVAQEIAAEFARKVLENLGTSRHIWDITYVDNIYIGVLKEEDARAAMQIIKELAQQYKAEITAEYFSIGRCERSTSQQQLFWCIFNQLREQPRWKNQSCNRWWKNPLGTTVCNIQIGPSPHIHSQLTNKEVDS